MSNCQKCGKETGPAFGLCADCIAVQDMATSVLAQGLDISILTAEALRDVSKMPKNKWAEVEILKDRVLVKYGAILSNGDWERAIATVSYEMSKGKVITVKHVHN